MSVKAPRQDLVFQLYLNKDRAASERLVRKIEAQGFRAIMVTVDAAVPGKRELDQRAKGEDLKVKQFVYERLGLSSRMIRTCPRHLGRAEAAGWALRTYAAYLQVCGRCLTTSRRQFLGTKTLISSVRRRGLAP